MSPVGHWLAHCALKPAAPGAAKPPAPAIPPSDALKAKQQTWPPEQCCVLEHASEDAEQEPGAAHVGANWLAKQHSWGGVHAPCIPQGMPLSVAVGALPPELDPTPVAALLLLQLPP